MKTLYRNYPKEKIQLLPPYVFQGPITVVDKPALVRPACLCLRRASLLGFDTETKPMFQKGKLNQVGLLQLSTPDECFLFRLNKMGLPPMVISLLEDEAVLKVGLSVHDDLLSLNRRAKVDARAMIDLQDVAKSMGFEDMSLRKLCANLLGGKLSKRMQLSNWNAPELTQPQQRYAATDAWCCIQLYNELHQLRSEGYAFIEPEPDNSHDTDSHTNDNT